jgi:3-phenylpropionate/trans-cinnamate dioxygenase ferredoxin reductase subunit
MGVVIVGAGQAGFQAAVSLRDEGYGDSIILIGEEPHLPYQRPPLSKGVLAGKQTIESTTLRPESFYRSHRIDVITDEQVTALDRVSGRVCLSSGKRIPYDIVILATGARVRKLPLENDALYLRDSSDAVELEDRLDRSASVRIIGGGFIGLEVASAARSLGTEVTVVETQARLMQRCVAPVVSEFYRGLHADNGVKVMLGETEISSCSADLSVVGIGVVPNAELARDAGLAIANGVAVDQFLQTSDPAIFAIGDCAEHPNVFASARVRLESVQNAIDHGKCAAANLVGRRQPYRAVPWFWTEQFDAKLQMAGLSGGSDRAVMRGDPQRKKFSVFYFKEDSLIGVDSINRPADHLAARKLLATGARITSNQAADDSFDLKSLIYTMPEALAMSASEDD